MHTLLTALQDLAEPLRLMMLIAGVLAGLAIGVIPGIGGVFGLTLLVPITYSLDPVAAFSLLLGMSSVTTTSDTIPAVLLGVPGTVGSAATAIDGHELAKQGHAARALGAAYSASLIGGVLGAILLSLALPVMRPIVLLFNYGDLLAITIFGLTLVALLTGGSQARGLLAALLGILVSFVGLDPYEGAERWTLGQVYLWDGIPTAILFLGLFGLPELAGLARRGQVTRAPQAPAARDLWHGMLETLRHWPLVLRSSAMGSLLGAIPGVGVTVIEWIAYGNAAQRPGDGPPFGGGNIRAVIAPESANNSKEGGALLPTLAFGIPGSAPMAILLGAFALHGLTPGPDLLTHQTSLLVTMILTIALANIIGTMICLGMTPFLARLAVAPATTLVPLALVFVTLGAFHSSKDIRDILVLLTFGLVGISFRGLGWSRPAFALGFVLGPNLERFFFLTYQISGWGWLKQPFVLVVLALGAATLLRQGVAWRKARETVDIEAGSGATFRPRVDLYLVSTVLAVLVVCAVSALFMPFATRLFPLIVCVPALVLTLAVAAQDLRAMRRAPDPAVGSPEGATGRMLLFLLAPALCGLLIMAFGHLLGPILFVLIYAIHAGRPRPVPAIITALGAAIFCYLVFDVLVSQTWPRPWFG